jgi:hypothetical protein
MLNDGNGGEPQQELELGAEGTPPSEPQGGDPLDAIQDLAALKFIATTFPAFKPENKEKLEAITDRTELLGEVKKIRAISQRHKPAEPKSPEATPATPAQPAAVLTKADFEKSNEKRAVRQAMADEDVKAHWAEIAPLYVNRRGRDTAEDILEDLKDAVILFKGRQGTPVAPNTAAADLAATAGVPGTGAGASPTEPAAKNPPNFKLPTSPKDWYKKPGQ